MALISNSERREISRTCIPVAFTQGWTPCLVLGFQTPSRCLGGLRSPAGVGASPSPWRRLERTL